MAYLLDSDVFIQAKNLHYGFDFCPAFWIWLENANAAARAFSIEKVGRELQAGNDDLSDWATARGPGFFLPADNAVLPALAQVSQWATTQQYEPVAVNTFFQVADYWLIGHALAQGARRAGPIEQLDLHAGQGASHRDKRARGVADLDPMIELGHGGLGGTVEVHQLHLSAEAAPPAPDERHVQRLAGGQHLAQLRQTADARGRADQCGHQRRSAVHELDARIAQPLEQSFGLEPGRRLRRNDDPPAGTERYEDVAKPRIKGRRDELAAARAGPDAKRVDFPCDPLCQGRPRSNDPLGPTGRTRCEVNISGCAGFERRDRSVIFGQDAIIIRYGDQAARSVAGVAEVLPGCCRRMRIMQQRPRLQLCQALPQPLAGRILIQRDEHGSRVQNTEHHAHECSAIACPHRDSISRPAAGLVQGAGDGRRAPIQSAIAEFEALCFHRHGLGAGSQVLCEALYKGPRTRQPLRTGHCRSWQAVCAAAMLSDADPSVS